MKNLLIIKLSQLMENELIAVYLTLSILLKCIILSLMIIHVHNDRTDDTRRDMLYVKDIQINHKQSFYQEVSKQASDNADKFKCSQIDLVRFTISVAYLETGAFKSDLVSHHNYFGIKSMSAKAKSFETTEYYKGKLLHLHQNFAVNNSITESIEQFFRLLQGQRYTSVRNATELPSLFKALQQSGYATDPRYASKLISISKKLF